jgi:hypothetical protein
MLSQTTPLKARDRDGAGELDWRLFAVPDGMTDTLRSLHASERTAALVMSGVRLSRSMTVAEIVAAVVLGVTSRGLDAVRELDQRSRKLTTAYVQYGLPRAEYVPEARRLWGSPRTWQLATGLAFRLTPVSVIGRARRNVVASAVSAVAA